MNKNYVLSNWLSSCLQGFAISGWDKQAIIKESEIYPDVLQARYCSVSDVLTVFAAAEKLYGESAGLESRKGIVPTSFNSLSLAVLASDSLYDGLRLMVEHNVYISDAARWYLGGDRDCPFFGFNIPPTDEISPVVYDAILSTIIRTCRFIVPKNNIIRYVEMGRPEPANTQIFEKYFKVPVVWGANQYAVHIEPTLLFEPSMHANSAVFIEHDQLVRKEEIPLVHSSFLVKLKTHIHSLLDQNSVSIEAVAQSLNVSVRTLQRRLGQEGMTFKKLLDSVRRQEAKKYIEETELSVSYVAHKLGFSDAGNFSRAYRRWFSCSPDQHRRNQNHNILGL